MRPYGTGKKYFTILLLMLALATATWAQGTSSTRIIAVVGASGFTLESDFPSTAYIDVVNQNSASLGNVTIKGRIAGTWTIRITSANGGRMRGDSAGNGFLYPYLFSFGTDSAIDLAKEYVYITGAGIIQATYPIGISFRRVAEIDPLPPSDTYRDSITVTVRAN